MITRLILENKNGINWFQQFWLLKKQLKLNMRESIKIFMSIKKGKSILIQAIKDEVVLNNYIDYSYHVFKDIYTSDLINTSSPLSFIVDANHYTCYIIDYIRGYRIYISRM